LCARRLACLAGVAAVVIAWLVIGASWYLNRDWFVLTRDAFSDLGGGRSCCPGLYNYGLVLSGLFILAYSSCLYYLARIKLEVLGAGYVGLAGVFLGLIGVFHEGTRPHVFVSTWFFVQMDLGLILQSIGFYVRTRGWEGFWSAVLSLLAFPVAILVGLTVGWPSAAVLEAYGVIVIDAVVLLLSKGYMLEARGICGP